MEAARKEGKTAAEILTATKIIATAKSTVGLEILACVHRKMILFRRMLDRVPASSPSATGCQLLGRERTLLPA
jgi:hypothetical protein